MGSLPPQNKNDSSALAAPAAEPEALLPDEENDHHVVAAESAEPVDPEEAALNEHRMTLLEHLVELRVRLRNAAIAFLLAMIVSFVFVAKFFELLTRPVRRGMVKAGFPPELNVMKVTEVFWVYMKLAILSGVLIASPFVFWELWKFPTLLPPC